MDWIAIFLAGVCECGWPLGLKLGHGESGTHRGWIVFAVVCIVASGALLLYAQLSIPMGTAYAAWTGIGAVGTFALGILVFKEPARLARFVSVGLIVAGILGLKLVA